MSIANYTDQFLKVLITDIGISQSDLSTITRYRDLDHRALSVALWQYNLISSDQLLQLWDWLDHQEIHLAALSLS